MNPEIQNLLEWAKFACEESRALYGYGTGDPNDSQPPTWLAELEDAVAQVENSQNAS